MVPHVTELHRHMPSFCAQRPVDLVHLALQTQGDRNLETEVLGLFLRQSPDLLNRIAQAPAARARFEAAHKLKGSARAIGANRVAEGAEAVEIAALAGDDCAEALSELVAAIAAANRFITDILT